MPFEVVLLVAAFFAMGLVVIAQPVSEARLDRFSRLNSLALTETGRARLRAYLLRRRQQRTAGVLIAAAIGLMISIPENHVTFAYVPLLAGWLAGAVVAEYLARSGTPRAAQPTELPYWWRSVPYAAAAIAVLWTTAAVYFHSEGVDPERLVLWGGAALLAALATLGAVRHVAGRALSDMDDELQPAFAVNAARGLTTGGSILALACLARVWQEAVPGPYESGDNQFPTIAAGLVGIFVLWVCIQAATASTGPRPRRLWHWLAFAAVVALPLAWAVPVRLAQEPPISPKQANATAQVRLATGTRLKDARADLGLTSEDFHVTEYADFMELMGRVDMAPAPGGTRYEMFVLDGRTNAPIPNFYGSDGAGWYGGWSLVLPARYPWLAPATRTSRGPQDLSGDLLAVSPDGQEPLWFRGTIPDRRDLSIEDIRLVLMLTRKGDSYIYWAVQVPTTGKVLA